MLTCVAIAVAVVLLLRYGTMSDSYLWDERGDYFDRCGINHFTSAPTRPQTPPDQQR